MLDAVSREASATGEGKEVEVQPDLLMEAIEDLAGLVDGPSNLSTNPKYLNDLGLADRAEIFTVRKC